MKLNLAFVGLVFSALLFSGCTHKEVKNAEIPPATREPATGGDSGLFPSLFPKTYEGPFELSPEGFQRAPARVFLPLQYDQKAEWPLVVLLHGFSGTADKEDLYLTMRFRTSSRGFVLVVPEGTAVPKGTISQEGVDLGGNQFWNATDYCCDFGKTGVDDLGYLKKVLENVQAKYRIDKRKIYLIGHSNGGFMANRLACDGGNFAGIANLAGGSYADLSQCTRAQATPYLQIHAVDDPTISYGIETPYAGGLKSVRQWVERNGCKSPLKEQRERDFLFLVPGKDTKEERWADCQTGKPVAFWTIRPYKTKGHNSHVPLFHLNFTEAVLDFLFE